MAPDRILAIIINATTILILAALLKDARHYSANLKTKKYDRNAPCGIRGWFLVMAIYFGISLLCAITLDILQTIKIYYPHMPDWLKQYLDSKILFVGDPLLDVLLLAGSILSYYLSCSAIYFRSASIIYPIVLSEQFDLGFLFVRMLILSGTSIYFLRSRRVKNTLIRRLETGA